MKKSAALLGTFSFTLLGCFSAPEPVEIPEDWDKAAQTCFVAQALIVSGKIGSDEYKAITLEQFSDTIQYLLIASTKGETFKIEEVMNGLESIDPIVNELADKDYTAAVPECQKRFGVAESDGAPELPEASLDAYQSCYAMISFIQGGMEKSKADFGAKGESYKSLQRRLEKKLESDPELTEEIAAGDAEQMRLEGAKSAFAQGNPEAYLDKCVARFPAK